MALKDFQSYLDSLEDVGPQETGVAVMDEPADPVWDYINTLEDVPPEEPLTPEPAAPPPEDQPVFKRGFQGSQWGGLNPERKELAFVKPEFLPAAAKSTDQGWKQAAKSWQATFDLFAGNPVELPTGTPDKWEGVPWSVKSLEPEFWGSLVGEGIGSSTTFLGGVAVGGTLGMLVTAPTGPGVVGGGTLGAMAGGGLVSAMETLGTTYAQMRAKGMDHDGAVDIALKNSVRSAGLNAASVLVGGELFAPFKKLISNALLQSFVVQPGIGVIDQATGSLVTGDPIKPDDLIKAYLMEAISEGPATVGVMTGLGKAGEARGDNAPTAPDFPETRTAEEVVESERWQQLRDAGIANPQQMAKALYDTKSESPLADLDEQEFTTLLAEVQGYKQNLDAEQAAARQIDVEDLAAWGEEKASDTATATRGNRQAEQDEQGKAVLTEKAKAAEAERQRQAEEARTRRQQEAAEVTPLREDLLKRGMPAEQVAKMSREEVQAAHAEATRPIQGEPIGPKERNELLSRLKGAGHTPSVWLKENFPETSLARMTGLDYENAVELLNTEAEGHEEVRRQAEETAGRQAMAQRAAEAPPLPPTWMERGKSLEVRFAGPAPPTDATTTLRQAGFASSSDGRRWVALNTTDRQAVARRLAGETTEEAPAPAAPPITFTQKGQRLEVVVGQGERGPAAVVQQLTGEKFRYSPKKGMWYAALGGEGVTPAMAESRLGLAKKLAEPAAQAEEAPAPAKAPEPTVQVEEPKLSGGIHEQVGVNAERPDRPAPPVVVEPPAAPVVEPAPVPEPRPLATVGDKVVSGPDPRAQGGKLDPQAIGVVTKIEQAQDGTVRAEVRHNDGKVSHQPLEEYTPISPARKRKPAVKAEPKAATEEPQKQPWEMTRQEFSEAVARGKIHQATGASVPGEKTAQTSLRLGELNNYSGEDVARFYATRRGYAEAAQKGDADKSIDQGREELVRDALAEGKAIPAEVLADYPSLADQGQPAAPAVAPAAEPAPPAPAPVAETPPAVQPVEAAPVEPREGDLKNRLAKLKGRRDAEGFQIDKEIDAAEGMLVEGDLQNAQLNISKAEAEIESSRKMAKTSAESLANVPATPPREADYIMRPPMDTELAAAKAMKGQKKKVTVIGGTKEKPTSKEVKGEVFGDFALSKNTDVDPKERSGTRVTHLASGLHVGIYSSALDAKVAVRRLQAIPGMDWSAKDPLEKMTPEQGRLAVDIKNGVVDKGEDRGLAGQFNLGRQDYDRLYDQFAAMAKADPDFAGNPVMTVTDTDGDGGNITLTWRHGNPKEGGERAYSFTVPTSFEEGDAQPQVGQTVRISTDFLQKRGVPPARVEGGVAKGSMAPLEGEERATTLAFPGLPEAPARMPMRQEVPAGEPRLSTSAPQIIAALENIITAAEGTAPIRVGRIPPSLGAEGIFKVGPEVIRLNDAGNLTAATHETAHALEKALWGYGGQRPWGNAQARNELIVLGRRLYGDTVPKGGYESEGFAEFVRLYLTTDQAAESAPAMTAWFDGEVMGKNKKVSKAVEDARRQITEWREAGGRARLGASVVRSSVKEQLRSLKEKGKELLAKQKFLWVEIGHPLDIMTQEANARLGNPLRPSNDPYQLFTALRLTHTRKLRYMVENGMIDLAGNEVGPSLKQALAPIKGRRDDFTDYLVANRALALWDDPKGARNPGISREDAEQTFRELDSPEFQLAAQAIYDWNEGILNYTAQASPALAEVVAGIRARDPGFYIPLNREIFEQFDARLSTRRAGGNPLNYRLKGSGRRILDPLPRMITNAERMISSAHRQMISDAVVNLSKVEGMGFLVEEVPRNMVPQVTRPIREVVEAIKKKDGYSESILDEFPEDLLEETITFFAPAKNPTGPDPIVPYKTVDGIKWFYIKDPQLFKTMAGMEPKRLHPLLELFFGVPTSVFRLGTTGLRASFGLVNALRDPQSLVVNSQAQGNAGRVWLSWAGGMRDAALLKAGKPREIAELYQRLGVEMAQPLGEDTNQTRRAVRQLFESRGVKLIDVRNWPGFLQDFVQTFEAAPRLAEMKMISKDVGYTLGEEITLDQSIKIAIAGKQVTTDFTAGGELARIINRLVPFFNAAIQGARVPLRRLEEDPSRVLLRGLANLTIPTLAIWWLTKDEEWYKELPYVEKFMNWHIPIEFGGEKAVVRLPRGFEVGQVFAALPEALANAWMQENPQEAGEWFANFARVSSPPVLPPLVAEAREQYANWDYFWERPIVGRGLEGKPEKEQFNEYTSRVAVTLGRLFDESPQRIDHAIGGIFGGVGMDVVNLSHTGTATDKLEKELSDTPILGRFFLRGGQAPANPKSVNELYALLEKRQRASRSEETPETEAQRQQRLLLNDATQAESVLAAIRKHEPSYEKRQQLSKEMADIAQDALRRVAKDDLITPAERDRGQEQTEGAELRRTLQMVERGQEVDPADLRSMVAKQHAISASEYVTAAERRQARDNVVRLTKQVGTHQRYLDRLSTKAKTEGGKTDKEKYQELFTKTKNALKEQKLGKRPKER